MNTRMVVTTRAWFGGGADLTPVLDRRRNQTDADSINFHAAMRKACDNHAAVAPYDKYANGATPTSTFPTVTSARGIGGIFYDHHWTDDFEADFTFTQDVGEAFRAIYPAIVRANVAKPWTEADVIEQEVRRGRYAEFNLLHDRGTIFGSRRAAT